MSDHLSSTMLEQYRRGLMPPGELLDADDHLAVCAQCRELAAGGEAVQHALAAFTADMLALATEAPEHLSYEQIASFVSQETDEAQREAVLSHLNFCDVCAADVRSLSAFKAELFAAQDRRPAPSAFHTFQERPAALKERLAARLSALPQAIRGWSVTRFALSTAAVLILVGVSLWLLFVAQKRVPQDEVARTTPPTTEAPRPSRPEQPRPPTDVPPEQSGNAAPLDTSPPRGGQFSVTRAARAVAPPAGVHAAKASSAAGTLAALNDGKGRVTLERDGVVAGLPSLTPGLQRAVGLALRTQQAPTPALLRDLTGTAATLLGRAEAEDTFAVTAPVGTVVRSTRPTFDWHPLNGASSYIVTVLDADFNPVATSPRLTATSWTVPEPLRRGVVYRWQVTALKNGERVISPSALAPEARFKVLDDAATNELERAEQTCLGSHLACGVLYSGAGLLDDAEREFKALLDANPHSALAQELLSSVRKPRRPR